MSERKPKTVTIRCPACELRKKGYPLPLASVRQGAYGNCGWCYRQMRVVKPKGRISHE
jgi:hypothetical protein